jgi:hypothetical protein
LVKYQEVAITEKRYATPYRLGEIGHGDVRSS